jgi:hypothetical protein
MVINGNMQFYLIKLKKIKILISKIKQLKEEQKDE